MNGQIRPPLLEIFARSGDVLALAGILMAAILAIVLFWRAHPKEPLVIAALLFTVLVFVLSFPRYWNDVNGYGRVLTPLLILVALPSLARETGAVGPWWLGLVPTIAVTLRLGMEFTGAIGGVLRGLL